MDSTDIAIKNLVTNKGQIDGLPKNPRIIKDDRFEALKRSILVDPEMLQLRELIVIPYKNKFVIIGGNMRFEACKQLGYEFMPCKILDANTEPDKLRAYVVKDNIGFGEWNHELIANEWDHEEMILFGMDLPDIEIPDDIPDETTEKMISKKLIVECDSVDQLEKLFIELQNRRFVCELK